MDDDDDAHVDGASDATPRSESAAKRRHRWFLPLDPLCSAILERAIQHHETSDEIGVHLSRAKMVPYLIACVLECTCARTGELPPPEPPRHRVVEVNEALLEILDVQIAKAEQDVRIGFEFNRPEMLRRLILRAGRCTCAGRGSVAGALQAWQVPQLT